MTLSLDDFSTDVTIVFRFSSFGHFSFPSLLFVLVLQGEWRPLVSFSLDICYHLLILLVRCLMLDIAVLGAPTQYARFTYYIHPAYLHTYVHVSGF